MAQTNSTNQGKQRFPKPVTPQLAQTIFDVTARFCGRYLEKDRRTQEQMVEAARLGLLAVNECDKAPGAKGAQLQAARNHLETLAHYFEAYLQQNHLRRWDSSDPRRQALVDRRPGNADEVAAWVIETSKPNNLHQDKPLTRICAQNPASQANGFAEISANATLVLVGVERALLSRRLQKMSQPQGSVLPKSNLREI